MPRFSAAIILSDYLHRGYLTQPQLIGTNFTTAPIQDLFLKHFLLPPNKMSHLFHFASKLCSFLRSAIFSYLVSNLVGVRVEATGNININLVSNSETRHLLTRDRRLRHDKTQNTVGTFLKLSQTQIYMFMEIYYRIFLGHFMAHKK